MERSGNGNNGNNDEDDELTRARKAREAAEDLVRRRRPDLSPEEQAKLAKKIGGGIRKLAKEGRFKRTLPKKTNKNKGKGDKNK